MAGPIVRLAAASMVACLALAAPAKALAQLHPRNTHSIHVIGRNTELICSRQGLVLGFALKPFPSQTLWFVGLMLVAGMGTAFGLCRIRSRQTKRQSIMLERLVADRTRELEAAKNVAQAAVTAKNEVIANLNEAEARLAKLISLVNATLESTAEGILVVDLMDRVVSYNSKFVEMWRSPHGQPVIGESDRMLPFAAEAVKDSDAFLAKVCQLYHEPQAESFDIIELKDGRFFERYSHPHRLNGEVVGRVWSFRDITKQHEAAEALRESQALYQSLVDQLPAGVFRKDRAGRYVLVNSYFCRLKEVRPEDYLGKTPEELAAIEMATAADKHRDAWQLAKQGARHHEQIMETGRQIELEEQYTSADGSIRYMHVVKSPVFGPDGGIAGSQGVIMDLTESKQVEAELTYERELLRALLEKSEETIYFKDLESRFVRCSTAHARRFNVAGPEAMIGRRDSEFFTDEHAGQAFEDEQEVIRTGKPLIGKLEKETWSDGRVTWVLTSKMPLRNVQGEIIGTFGLSKDITELKEAQESTARERARLKFIFDSVPVGISLARYAPDGRLLERHINDAHLHLCGLTREQDQDHTIYGQITHPDDRNRQTELMRQVEAGKIHHFSIEKRYVRFDGKTVWVIFSFQRRRYPDGTYEDLCAVSDITANKVAEAEREKLNRQLVEASRQAGMAEVATSVLHNVGNVLNSVNVSATLALDIVNRSKVNHISRVADLIREQGTNLAAFVTTDPRGTQLPAFLMELGKHLANERAQLVHEIELTRQNIEHIKEIVAMQQSYAKVSGTVEKIKVVDLIEDALRMNSGALARHSVELIRDYPSEIPEITVERHKVLQILVNLIRNAKYACDDSGRNDKRLTVRLRSECERVQIGVIDNGVGITPENLTRIFNHGFTTRKGGHGFGLHSGALAAKEIGGTLTAQSVGPGCGATFTLELPLGPTRSSHQRTPNATDWLI